ncbi:hypothetical protein AMJ80_01475 [bacterium SM23_31]|nr:MAG: hypothetical protein AMJ80_01475 [bacterium SM23_31]
MPVFFMVVRISLRLFVLITRYNAGYNFVREFLPAGERCVRLRFCIVFINISKAGNGRKSSRDPCTS